MRSLLAGLLLVLAAAALLSRQLIAFTVLAPLAWAAASWAGRDHDDIGALMGACLMIATAITLTDCAGALAP